MSAAEKWMRRMIAIHATPSSRNVARIAKCTLMCVTLSLGWISMQQIPSAAAQTVSLPNCQGKPEVKPTDVVFACADAGFSATKLHWSSWGSASATATGLASVNDCSPNCVSGHWHTYPIILKASGKQICPSGERAYVRVTYAFIGKSPFPADAPGTSSAVQTFRCRSLTTSGK